MPRKAGTPHHNTARQQSDHHAAPGVRSWDRSARKRRVPLPTRQQALIGSAALLVLILCAYRILTFVPQPLDSPSTLRPILYGLFSKFITHYPNPERAQQAWASYCLVALFIPTSLAFLNYLSRPSVKPPLVWVHRVVTSRVLLFISLAACLIVCRFPFLLTDEINPDETLFIAAAQKLFTDPVFFRAVDCNTSGPINIFPLMLPGLFGFSPDYASTRVIALLIILASTYVIYRAFALLTDEGVARVAILPAAGAFAVFKYNDFLHYSSEHVSFLLLSLAFYVCVRTFCCPQMYAWNVAGLGVLTAAAFLAKLQAVPILGCVSAVAIAYVHAGGRAGRWWRPSLLFGAGLAPLLLANAIICGLAGVWHDFWMEYIVGNYSYVESHGTRTSELLRFTDLALSVTEVRLLVTSLLAILAAYFYQRKRPEPVADHVLFLQMGVVGGIVAVAAEWLLRTGGAAMVSFAVMISILMLPGSFFLLYRKADWTPEPVRWFGFLAAAVLAAAAAAAYTPRRLYGHYLLLLVLPLTIATAWPVVAASAGAEPADGKNDEDLSERRRSRVALVLVFGALTLACQLFELGSPDFMAFAAMPSTVRAPESELIEALTLPKGKITVWGWNNRLYLGAGRVSAAKELTTGLLLSDNPEVRAYYRDGYVRALRRDPPELFIDAIETSYGAFDRHNRFELIPELNVFIQSDYVHVVNAYKEGFYIRRDLARSVAGIGDPRKCDTQAIRCFEAGAGAWIPSDLPSVQMPEHALLEVTFTPETKQDLYATVFSNDGGLATRDGFQFQHLAMDRYRLAIGWGPEWAVSKELMLPQRRPVSLGVEFNGDLVTIVCNGAKRDEMRLPKRMLDSPGPITVGSWIGHQRPFLGNIQFFQIRNLGQRR